MRDMAYCLKQGAIPRGCMDHTIFGLIKKRGEIAGQYKVAQKASDAIKADL